MLLNMNPDEFTIPEKKAMGMWPPGDLVTLGLFPYIFRLKTDNLQILEVGVGKGENVYSLLTLDENRKIATYWGISYDKDTTILKKNVEGLDRFQLNPPEIMFDVVCMDSEVKNLSKRMSDYYKRVKSNGIFCGNNHADTKVKEALHTFRRRDRIGTPILISRGSWFWNKR